MSLRQVYLNFVEGAFLALARLCLNQSIRIQEVLERLKRAYITAAKERLDSANERVTTSKISLMTGIHRRDVERLQSGDPVYEGSESLIAKVVGAWQGSPKLVTRAKKPRALLRSEFDELVKSVSKELSPASVLFELERIGVVTRVGSKIELLKATYSPSDKVQHGLDVLAADLGDLIRGVDENLNSENSIPNLHARTIFDNVRPEHLDDLRAFLVREGHQLHLKARNYLSALDQDLNPDPKFVGEGIKVVLGSFSRIDSKGK